MLFALIFLSSVSYAQLAAKWTFETSVPTTSGPIPAETGTGEANCFHAGGSASYTNPAGNGSAESYSSNNWASGDYYQFHTSTLSLPNVAFAFDHTSSGTGPKSFFIEVSLDGLVFTSLAGTNYDVSVDSWSSVASGYVAASHHSFLLPGMENKPDVYVRIKLASGNTSANGGTIAGTGTSRVDNVSVGSASVVLPVSINNFILKRFLSQNSLEWKTAMEKDMNYFVVEKSLDGKNFNEIAKVGASNNICGNAYQFSDYDAQQNACYRLRIFEKNGKSSLSKTVYGEGFNANSVVSCPFNIVTNGQPLLLNIKNGKLKYWVISNDGKTIAQGHDNREDSRALPVSFSNYSNGIYVIKTISDGGEQTFRVIKQ